ncbi:hypothetical protein EV126DRAFT_320787, partial [Verticillium dahliae]
PGARERLVLLQHNYCNNFFWERFWPNITLCWQYNFHDCFATNIGTGLFQLSATFEDCIRDIRSWTMGAEFFEHFPEMRDDILVHDDVVPSL